MTTKWLDFMIVWYAIFWMVEGLRRAYCRRNREARDAKDPFTPSAPMQDLRNTRSIERQP